MRRFKVILFYADGKADTRFSLDRAVDLGKRKQGRLTVVNVLGELPRELRRLAAALPSEDLPSTGWLGGANPRRAPAAV